jgi:hypothetical protein
LASIVYLENYNNCVEWQRAKEENRMLAMKIEALMNGWLAYDDGAREGKKPLGWIGKSDLRLSP